MAIASNFPAIKPSLLLDFANTKKLDPRITFTRTTTATYYDGVTTAKAEENLLLQSQFAASWTNYNATLTANTTTAPDGTSTAATVVENTANNQHVAYQFPTLTTSATYTFSCYFKAGTRNYGMLRDANNAIKIDLTNGTTTVIEGSPTSHSATSVGNGWYRCVMTLASINNNFQVGPHDNGSTTTYTGNGTGSVYVWGAQLEQRSSATAYTATTTQAITNYIPKLLTAGANQPRFDHNPTTGESLGLLIEEARTNLLTYSQSIGTSPWAVNSGSLSTNAAIAPDGTLTASRYIESSSNTQMWLYNTANATSGVTYTFTAYIKSFGRQYGVLQLADASVPNKRYAIVVDLSNGSVTNTGSVSSPTNTGYAVTSVGNGWYRISVTMAAATTSTIYAQAGPAQSSTGNFDSICIPTYQGNGFSGILIWGAQLEAGSFATSYIPTVASTVTRNADAASMTETNFSSWYNNSAGTFYVESQNEYNVTNFAGTGFETYSGFQTNMFFISAKRDGDYARGVTYMSPSGVDLVSLAYANTSATTFYKYAGAMSKTALSTAIMGVGATKTINLGVPPMPTVFAIGSNAYAYNYFVGHIKKLAYYPVGLTVGQLQALTT